MIPRSFTTMSVNFYTTQQTIHQSKILAFFFRVSVNKGAKKRDLSFIGRRKSTVLPSNFGGEQAQYIGSFSCRFSVVFLFYISTPTLGCSGLFGGKLRQTFFLVIVFVS